MNNYSKKIVTRNWLVTGVFLGILLALGISVVAFSEPTQAPPGGNVAAPINVSGTAQTKAGKLNIGGGLSYWITKVGDSFALENNAGATQFVIGQDGNVGIGTGSLSEKLDINGGIYLENISNPTDSDISALLGTKSFWVKDGLIASNVDGFGLKRSGIFFGNNAGLTIEYKDYNSGKAFGRMGRLVLWGGGGLTYDMNEGDPFLLNIEGYDTTAKAANITTIRARNLRFQGTDFRMDGSAWGRGDEGRALVQDNGDTLAINYAGDFSGGVRVDSKLNAPQLCINNDCRSSWPGGGGTPNLQQVTDVGNTTNRDIGITCCGNLRLWGGIYDTYGGGDSWFLDLDRDARIRQMQVYGPLYVGPDYVRGDAGDGDLKVAGRISSQNRSPSCPNGWGCGVHTWDVYADASIYGTYIHSPNKFFSIPHPLDPENKILVHATIEGPESAVFYRGEGTLTDGRAVVILPHYFEALTRKEGRTVLLTHIDGFDPLAVESQNKELVKDGQFIVVSSNKNSSQRFIWEVKAVRADVKPLKVERDKNEPPYDEDQLPKGVTKPDDVE